MAFSLRQLMVLVFCVAVLAAVYRACDWMQRYTVPFWCFAFLPAVAVTVRCSGDDDYLTAGCGILAIGCWWLMTYFESSFWFEWRPIVDGSLCVAGTIAVLAAAIRMNAVWFAAPYVIAFSIAFVQILFLRGY